MCSNNETNDYWWITLSRNKAVTTAQTVLVTLRFYATGSFVYVTANFAGIHKTTAGRTVKQVSEVLAVLRPDFVTFPTTEAELRQVRQDFYNISKFPS